MGVPIHLREQIEQINHHLSYCPMKQDQAQRSHQMREKAKELAFLMVEVVPGSNELERALNDLTSAMMWADEAIKREVRRDGSN